MFEPPNFIPSFIPTSSPSRKHQNTQKQIQSFSKRVYKLPKQANKALEQSYKPPKPAENHNTSKQSPAFKQRHFSHNKQLSTESQHSPIVLIFSHQINLPTLRRSSPIFRRHSINSQHCFSVRLVCCQCHRTRFSVPYMSSFRVER
jgi:hypothetical protein